MGLVIIQDTDFITNSREVINDNFNYLDSKPSGSYNIYIPYTLAIGSDLGPRIFIPTTTTPTNVRADVKLIPIGSNIIINLYQTNTLWMSLVIPNGNSFVVPSLVGVSDILINQYWRVDIISVGTTFPGSDLNISIS
jgi:hypothetical protein